MKLIICLILLIYQNVVISQNPFIGTWVSYDLLKISKKQTLNNIQTTGFKSTILFKEDLSFQMRTNKSILNGYYEITSNTLKFYTINKEGEEEHLWYLRWPKDKFDPYPQTPEVDIVYPHLFNLKKPTRKYSQTALDVCYKKEN